MVQIPKFNRRNIITTALIASVLLMIVGALSLNGMFTEAEPIASANVEPNDVAGTWYNLYSIPDTFDYGCTNQTATYTVIDDSSFKVENTCNRFGLWESKVSGTATAIPNTQGKFTIDFGFMRKGTLVVLEERPNYLMLGSPDRSNLWILGQEKNIDEQTKTELFDRAEELGFNTDKLKADNGVEG